MVKYPPHLESEVILLIVEIVRNGQIVEKKAEFGEAIWNVQGVLQGFLLGVPDGEPLPVGKIARFSVSELEDLVILKNAMVDAQNVNLPVASVGFDPTIIGEIIRLIMLLLQLFKEAR